LHEAGHDARYSKRGLAAVTASFTGRGNQERLKIRAAPLRSPRRAAPSSLGAIASQRAAEAIGRPFGAPVLFDRFAALTGSAPARRKRGVMSRAGEARKPPNSTFIQMSS
jgi:hypothetical protein